MPLMVCCIFQCPHCRSEADRACVGMPSVFLQPLSSAPGEMWLLSANWQGPRTGLRVSQAITIDNITGAKTKHCMLSNAEMLTWGLGSLVALLMSKATDSQGSSARCYQVPLNDAGIRSALHGIKLSATHLQQPALSRPLRHAVCVPTLQKSCHQPEQDIGQFHPVSCPHKGKQSLDTWLPEACL